MRREAKLRDRGAWRRPWAATAVLASVVIAVAAPRVPAAADPASPPAGRAAGDAAPLTVEQALAQARQTGTPVEASGATTATDTVVANPGGSLTLTRSAVPVRARMGGAWRALDPTLHANADGTVAPAATASAIRLSGGGTAPLARLSIGGRSLELSLPMSLPAPTLSGPVATYPQVLSGVDLRVSVDAQGGFSQVFVVRDAAAAANPALRTIRLAARAQGVRLTTDEAGNIAAIDSSGRAAFTAPAPIMWDSAVAPAAPAAASLSSASSADGPGVAARTAPVRPELSATGLDLTPDAAMLTSPDTEYPVYVDPNWSSTGSANSGWATVGKPFGDTNYWKKTPDPHGRMQVGNSGSMWSHTLINFPIATGTLAGATIRSATLNITETYAFSCRPSKVNLYAPGATLTSSNATWKYWDGVNLGAVVNAQNVAHGYNDSCPAAGVAFNVLNTVKANAAGGKKTQTFVLTGENEAGDTNSWKEFLQTSPTMTIEYNHAPRTPSGLRTSPTTSCAAATPTAVGDGPVYLYAPVSDPDGGTVGVAFQLWKTSAAGAILASSDPARLRYASGTTAVLVVPQATLKAAAGTAITQFSWRVQITDDIATSPWSTTCAFRFDPTRTGAPTVAQPEDTTIGAATTVAITAPAAGTAPTGYIYQLNGGTTGTVAAATGGTTTVSVTPTRFTNTLTVTGLSEGGNVGGTANVTFNASPAAVAVDADLTGDGAADLLAVGGTGSPMASGLWLARGKNTGGVLIGATNVGTTGNGLTENPSPSVFDGAQAITGHFTGSGLQDVFAYYPTGADAGEAVVLHGNGDGSPIQAQHSGNANTVPSDTLADPNGKSPAQVVNAGSSSGTGLVYPDLLTINGDASASYLTYLQSTATTGDWAPATVLGTATPDGGTDWASWRLASTQLATGAAVFLWKPGTGALYLWRNLSFDPGQETLQYTQYSVATNWNTGAALQLRAADINADGNPDVWTVGARAALTAWLSSGPAGSTVTVAAQPAQTLLTATHNWLLNDAITGPISAAKDSIGSLNAAGTAGITWNTGDLFDPDALLDGTGALGTTAAALNTNADFTVAAWVKPTSAGGTVLSQDGTQSSGFKVWIDASDTSWRFAMPTADVAAPAYDTATAGPGSARLGAWTQVIATYEKATGAMAVYLNGVKAGVGTHTTVWNAARSFRIGDGLVKGAHTGLFTGQIADVRAGSTVIVPAQTTVWSFHNVRTGKCLDQSFANGTEHREAIAFSCSTTLNQLWSLNGNTIVNTATSKCLDQNYGGGTEHQDVIVYPCSGQPNQQWTQQPDGTIRNVRSGKCLDQSFAGGVEGPDVIAHTCTGEPNQKWTRS